MGETKGQVQFQGECFEGSLNNIRKVGGADEYG
jgi:hypothetical protein